MANTMPAQRRNDSGPTTDKTDFDVIIVGAGPVGLFLGLNLSRAGLEILVIEREEDIVQSPRALMYFPIVLNEFRRTRILEEVVAAGYKNQSGLTFRTPASGSNKVLAKIPPPKTQKSSTGEEVIDYGVQLGQPKLTAIIRRHALEEEKFTLKYGTRFERLEETEGGVVVTAKTQIRKSNDADKAEEKYEEKEVIYSAKFVVACDGASSPVRKFLNIPFTGFTWEDFRFLAINIKYPFDKHGYPAANHVIDPQDWAVIVRAGNEKEGLWRVATGIDPKVNVEDKEELNKAVREKLEKLLPGPRPLQYELVDVSPYWAHERVVDTYKKGRVVLAGDAAHVNNPLTALGLTTGLVDVAYLSRLLPLAFAPKYSTKWSTLLDKYATLRRTDFLSRVQKQTIEGKQRIHSTDTKVVAQRDDFFNMLNKNPEFGLFVASTMMESVPDELFPGPIARFHSVVSEILKILTIVPMIIFWKIRASVS